MNNLSFTIQKNKTATSINSWLVQLFSNASTRAILLFLLLLVASFFPIWGASYNLHERNDDTYITLTYAKSLAAGEGWGYNGDPQALGTTTPLFAIIIASLAYLLPNWPIEEIAVGWSTFCWLATGWLFFLGHRDFGLTRRGGAFIGLSIVLQGGWWLVTLGMEATFLVFGLTLNIWLIARGHAFLSGVISALLFLIRPEGLAMVPLTGAWLLWHQRTTWRETLMRFALGALLPLGLWALYAQYTFGSILANSAKAKIGQGSGWPGKPFIERLMQQWLPSLATRYGVSSSLSLLWPLVLLGLIHAAQRLRPLLLFALWTLIFLAAYSYLHAPGYWWYMMPVLFALHLFAITGLLFFFHQPQRGLQISGVILALFYLTVTVNVGIKSVYNSQPDPRASTYLAVAEWLNSNTPRRSTVAFVEIGYLGYFSENRIIDLVGLVDPAFRDNGANLDLASNFWQAEPEYFLYAPDFNWLLGPIVEDERFPQKYRIVTEVPSHLSTPLMIYQKQK